MLHHVELYVSDLERSVAFWTPFMSMLGYEPRRWSGGMNYVRGVEEPTSVCCKPTLSMLPPGITASASG